jgi:hypothetical protein
MKDSRLLKPLPYGYACHGSGTRMSSIPPTRTEADDFHQSRAMSGFGIYWPEQGPLIPFVILISR